MTKPLLIAVALLLSGCGNLTQHDQKLIKDASGQVYKLEWRVGGLYAVEPIDTTQLNKINKLTTTP